ncbi:MAG TPA: hypothetical protein VHB73_05980 [Alphaproteobacteria bacterium]|nr:hypothetical protein [Alphaproteobacteria bacterium]
MQVASIKVSPARANHEAGFNLIEAAIVLGIVGLIVGGIWAAAGAAYENMRLQNASKQLLALVGGIRGFYAQNPTDVVDTNIDNLYGFGILPADMVVVNGTTHELRHPWGDSVTIATTTLGGSAFTISYTGMKADSCKNFVTRVGNVARGSGLLIASPDGSAEWLNLYNDPAQTNSTVPACDANGGSPSFTFSVRG